VEWGRSRIRGMMKAASPMGGRWEAAGEQDAGRPKGRPYNGRFRGGVGAGIEVVVSLETERAGI
jgi:hypothetical protein